MRLTERMTWTVLHNTRGRIMSGSESLHMFSNKKIIMFITVYICSIYCKHWILTYRLDHNLFCIGTDIFGLIFDINIFECDEKLWLICIFLKVFFSLVNNLKQYWMSHLKKAETLKFVYEGIRGLQCWSMEQLCLQSFLCYLSVLCDV